MIGSFVFDFKSTRSEKLTLDGLEKGKNINFSMKTNDGGAVKLQNSSVKLMWSINLDYGCKKDITVKNSDIDLFWIKFPPTEKRIKITDMKRGYLKEFVLDEHIQGMELPYKLRIIDSTLEGCFKPEMLGTMAEIDNSYVMAHPYGDADLIIRDSTVTTIINYGSKRVEFIDTELTSSIQLLYKEELKNGLKLNGEVIGPGGDFHLIFRNSRINVDHIIVACGQGRIEGDVEVISPRGMDEVHWFKGVVERNYILIVKSASGEPVENAEVVVRGLKEETRAINDENGEAFVTIQFDKENYDKVYTIEVCYKDNKLAEEITFLSSTPVVFTIPPLPTHTTTPTPTSKPFNWLPIVGILGGVIVVALLVFLLRRRRAT